MPAALKKIDFILDDTAEPDMPDESENGTEINGLRAATEEGRRYEEPCRRQNGDLGSNQQS
jgi:hypothetical protein